MINLDKNLIEAYNQEAFRKASEARAEGNSAGYNVFGILFLLAITPVVFWLVQAS